MQSDSRRVAASRIPPERKLRQAGLRAAAVQLHQEALRRHAPQDPTQQGAAGAHSERCGACPSLNAYYLLGIQLDPASKDQITSQIRDLDQEVANLLAEAEQHGATGAIAKSQECTEQAENLKEQREELRKVGTLPLRHPGISSQVFATAGVLVAHGDAHAAWRYWRKADGGMRDVRLLLDHWRRPAAYRRAHGRKAACWWVDRRIHPIHSWIQFRLRKNCRHDQGT